MSNKVAAVLATWFGCGLAPVAPGTVASAGAIAIAWVLHEVFGWGRVHWLAMVVVFIAPAIRAAGSVARELGVEDPGRVVMDEVLGQWLALIGAVSLTPRAWLLAFGLFRIFDIWKPYPVRRLERLPGGYGIVADDLAAGLYAAGVLFLFGEIWPS